MIQKYIEWKKKILELRLEKQKNKKTKFIPPSRKLKFDTEVPYNHYGDRGFIDLLITTKRRGKIERKHMIEFKTEIRDLGEMLRQFKKMEKYYPEADEDGKDEWFDRKKRYIPLLMVKKTSKNNRILIENRDYIGLKSFNSIRLWNPDDKSVTYGKQLLENHQ